MKTIIALALLFLSVATTGKAQQRKALIIGIDKYKVNEGGWGIDLQGCVNDALAVKGILMTRFGFNESEIQTLFNEQATRDNIIQSMVSLADQSKKDDVIFIYYAGHGVNMHNSLSEKNGYSQGILASDIFKTESSVVRDNDQKRIFNKIINHNAILTVIYDCCYSEGNSKAGMAREIDTTGGDRGMSYGLLRLFESEAVNDPNSSTKRSLPFDDDDLKDKTQVIRPQDIKNSRYLFLAATTDQEESKERRDINYLPHGVFTAALVDVIKNNKTSIPVEELYRKINLQLSKQYTIAQHPRKLADPARLQMNLLGTNLQGIPEGTQVKVSDFRDNNVVTEGGLAIGMTPGNILKGTGSNKNISLKIEKLMGMNHAIAKVQGGNITSIKKGEVFEVTDWYASTPPMLKIYLPAIKCPLSEFNAFTNIILRPAINDNLFTDYSTTFIRGGVHYIFFNKGKWTDQLMMEGADQPPGQSYSTIKFSPGGNEQMLFANNHPDLKTFKAKINGDKYFIYLPVPGEVYKILESRMALNQNVTFVSDPAKADLALYAAWNKESQKLIFTCSVDLKGNIIYKTGHRSEAITTSFNGLTIAPAKVKEVADQIYDLIMQTVSFKGWLNEYPKRAD